MAPKSAAPKKRSSSSAGWKALPAEDIKRFKSFVTADKNRKNPNPHTDALGGNAQHFLPVKLSSFPSNLTPVLNLAMLCTLGLAVSELL
eukprot:s6042_g5.t1